MLIDSFLISLPYFARSLSLTQIHFQVYCSSYPYDVATLIDSSLGSEARSHTLGEVDPSQHPLTSSSLPGAFTASLLPAQRRYSEYTQAVASSYCPVEYLPTTVASSCDFFPYIASSNLFASRSKFHLFTFYVTNFSAVLIPCRRPRALL